MLLTAFSRTGPPLAAWSLTLTSCCGREGDVAELSRLQAALQENVVRRRALEQRADIAAAREASHQAELRAAADAADRLSAALNEERQASRAAR
jgi:hypothetical protein